MAAMLRAFRGASNMRDGRFWTRFATYWTANIQNIQQIEARDLESYTQDVQGDEEEDEDDEEDDLSVANDGGDRD